MKNNNCDEVTSGSDSPVWLMGVGDSLLHHKAQIKGLNEHITVGLHKFFPHCVEHFGFTPTYWTWYDPRGATPGLDYLLALKELPTNLEVLVPYSHTLPLDLALEHLRMKDKKSRPWGPTTRSTYQDYSSKLSTLRDRGLKVHSLNTLNNYFLKNTVGKELSSVSFEERFRKEQMILGTSTDATTSRTDGPFESKLTYYMFPLIQYMGIKKAFVMGFDAMGGRFWAPEVPVVNGHNLKYVTDWKEWFAKLDIESYSATPSEHTHLNKFLEYMPLETAIGLSRPPTLESKKNQIENIGRILDKKFNVNIYSR